MTPQDSPAFLFDDVRIEPAMFRAFKAGNAIQLEPKALRLLLFLVENRGRLVEKEEILENIWNGTHVTENALVREIAKLRKILGDDPKAARYIQTVHTRGYRFIAEVQVRDDRNTTQEPSLLARESNGLDPAVQGSSEGQKSQDEASSRRETPEASWGKRLLVVGVMVALAIAVLIGLKIARRPNPAVGTSPPFIRQITAWPGLACNPTFSPDGESIAYSSDHSGSFEIYVKSLAPGARDNQLTADGQQNFDPAWSPDGKRIAYYSMKRHGIFIMPAFGGVVRQLTEFGSHPAWSPDSQWLTFQSVSSPDLGAMPMGKSTIWIVSSQGGAPRQLTRTDYPAGSHFAPSWSPDAKRIAFLNFNTISSEVWSIAATGDKVQPITKRGGVDKSSPVYSPDGKSIYYNWGQVLWKTPISLEDGAPVGEPVKVADLGSTVMRNATVSASGKLIAYSSVPLADDLISVPISPITNESTGPPSPVTNEPGTRHFGPSFSPDGLKIAFVAQRRGSNFNVWTTDADGGNPTQVTVDGGRHPTWYPDGKQLAFLSVRQGHRKFWSIASAGGNEKSLFELQDFEDPQMSPDARQVAFNFTKDGIINVATVSMAGGEPKHLTDDRELAGWPSWSPDGKFLALEIKRGDDTHIAIIPSSGGELTQLTFDHGQSWPHSWSPDGDKIVFAGTRDGIWNVWWVSRSDKTVKQLTHNTKLNAFFRYPAWSPLGNRIVSEYSEHRGNIYVMALW